MVGSEPELFRRKVAEFVLRSPSPHGRVGTSQTQSLTYILTVVSVPSWSGRNQFRPCRSSSTTRSLRPLMVGSELLRLSFIFTLTSLRRRPLMVGSEPSQKKPSQKSKPSSPSPHGRVGTPKP